MDTNDLKWSSDIETDMRWSIRILDMDTSFSMRMRGVLPLCLSTMSMGIRIKRMGGEIMDHNTVIDWSDVNDSE